MFLSAGPDDVHREMMERFHRLFRDVLPKTARNLLHAAGARYRCQQKKHRHEPGVCHE
jgi:hypothetical protein